MYGCGCDKIEIRVHISGFYVSFLSRAFEHGRYDIKGKRKIENQCFILIKQGLLLILTTKTCSECGNGIHRIGMQLKSKC